MLNNKLRTAIGLLREGKFRCFLRTSTDKIIRVTRYRVDILDIDESTIPPPSEQYLWKAASEQEVKTLFETWPDSIEELRRHRQAYFDFGFRRCFFLIDRFTGELLYFQFLITEDDWASVRKHFPWRIYKSRLGDGRVWRAWLYTLQKHRGKNLAFEATKFFVQMCRQRNIHWAYARRGSQNVASVKLGKKEGVRQVGTIFQIQFFRQSGHAGLFFYFPVKGKPEKRQVR